MVGQGLFSSCLVLGAQRDWCLEGSALLTAVSAASLASVGHFACGSALQLWWGRMGQALHPRPALQDHRELGGSHRKIPLELQSSPLAGAGQMPPGSEPWMC